MGKNKPISSVGKTVKYFKYATGEIALVVIGIMLALQMNTWKEAKNNTITTNTYLTSLKIEIDKNIKLLEIHIDQLDKDIIRAATSLKRLNSDDAKYFNQDSLQTIMSTAPIYKTAIRTSTFNDLVNSGTLKFLENKDVKNEILSIEPNIELFKENFELAKDVWEGYQLPYLMEHSHTSGNWDSIRGVKIDKPNFKRTKKAFVHNKIYANILALRMRMVANYANKLSDCKENFLLISSSLDNYLKEKI